jgi:hypothetical protein
MQPSAAGGKTAECVAKRSRHCRQAARSRLRGSDRNREAGSKPKAIVGSDDRPGSNAAVRRRRRPAHWWSTAEAVTQAACLLREESSPLCIAESSRALFCGSRCGRAWRHFADERGKAGGWRRALRRRGPGLTMTGHHEAAVVLGLGEVQANRLRPAGCRCCARLGGGFSDSVGAVGCGSSVTGSSRAVPRRGDAEVLCDVGMFV